MDRNSTRWYEHAQFANTFACHGRHHSTHPGVGWLSNINATPYMMSGSKRKLLRLLVQNCMYSGSEIQILACMFVGSNCWRKCLFFAPAIPSPPVLCRGHASQRAAANWQGMAASWQGQMATANRQGILWPVFVISGVVLAPCSHLHKHVQRSALPGAMPLGGGKGKGPPPGPGNFGPGPAGGSAR